MIKHFPWFDFKYEQLYVRHVAVGTAVARTAGIQKFLQFVFPH
jgi:hypothetical protein